MFEEWEKSPNVTIDTKINPQFDLSMNSQYRTKVEPMKDIHIAKSLFDDKLYFKSVSGFMSKEKTPISETRRHFVDKRGEKNGSSLAMDSLDCIPETFMQKGQISIQQ